MKINAQTVSVGTIIALLFAMGGAYLEARDRLTRIEAKLEIISPMAIDYMVEEELRSRGIMNPEKVIRGDIPDELPRPIDTLRRPIYGEETTGADGVHPEPIKPLVSPDEVEEIRKEKRHMFEQRS